MKFEIASKFDVGDRVHFGNEVDMSGTIAKADLFRGQGGEYRVMYLIEQADETRDWWHECEIYPYGMDEAEEE